MVWISKHEPYLGRIGIKTLTSNVNSCSHPGDFQNFSNRQCNLNTTKEDLIGTLLVGDPFKADAKTKFVFFASSRDEQRSILFYSFKRMRYLPREVMTLA